MTKVPAADNVLRILDFLSGQRGPLPAAKIAAHLGLPRSSVYQLLAVMMDRGYISHVPEEKRYGLGPTAYSLGSSFARQQPLTRLGAPLIARLVDRLGHSAHLAILHGTDVLYLVEERARNRPSLITDVGVRLPASVTASGRAMLASLPPAQLRAMYPRSDEYGRVKRLLEPARAAGYATERDDVTVGLSSFAVPVIDHTGWPAAAVAVTFPSSTVADNAETTSTARELSRRIHGHG